MRKLLVVTINDLYIFLSKSSIVLAAEDELSRMIYALSIQGGDSLIRQSLAFYTVCCLSPNNKLLLCVCVCVFYFSFFWGGRGGCGGFVVILKNSYMILYHFLRQHLNEISLEGVEWIKLLLPVFTLHVGKELRISL